MDGLAQLGPLADQVLLLALTTCRIAVAFLLLPLFTGDLLPATVRNAVYVTFGLVALALQPPASTAQLMQVHWLLLFLKEAFIGAGVGFLFGSVLWAFQAAGALIDTKIGATTAQATDPFSGQQTPLTGSFMGRLANFVFMFSGGLLLLVGTLLDTYRLWPVLAPTPVLAARGVTLFEAEFGRLMLLSLLLAGPALVLLFAVDAILGLVGRFAQQLNVYSLAMSIKTWVATLMLMIMLTSMTEQLIADLRSRPGLVLKALQSVLGG